MFSWRASQCSSPDRRCCYIAVAVASPDTMRLPPMNPWANTPARMVISRKRQAAWPSSSATFPPVAPPSQLHSYRFLLLCVSELQQVAWLALHCLADGLERGESDCASLSSFQDRQVGERDSDSLGQLRERHSTLVKHLVHLDDDRHGQTVPSRSSRMRAPCSKTRANTKSSSTVSHRVSDNPELMLSGAAAVETPAAIAPTVKCINSRPRIAQAIVFRRTAFATTKGFPTLTVSTMVSSRLRMRCTMGTEQMPMTMIRRISMNNIELPGAGRALSAPMTRDSATRLAIINARITAPMSRFSLVSTRRTIRDSFRVSGYDLVTRPSPSLFERGRNALLNNDNMNIVYRQAVY